LRALAGIALDFRDAARGLVRHRSVAALSVICIALGIGTSAAMLGILDALLFRPPAHVAKPEAVKRIYISDRLAGFGEETSSHTSFPVSQDLETVKALRRDLTAAIRSSGRERRPGRSRLSTAIASAQIALTLLLLSGAGKGL